MKELIGFNIVRFAYILTILFGAGWLVASLLGGSFDGGVLTGHVDYLEALESLK
jgi:uncharacterized membrane protein YhdT